MSDFMRLRHLINRFTYPFVWTLKCRFRIPEGFVKALLANDIHVLFAWKPCELIEMRIQTDHIHLIISDPPKLSVSQLSWILKGKTAIRIFNSYPQPKTKPFWGNHFWTGVYCFDSIFPGEDKIKKYAQYQDKQERIKE